MDTLAFIFALIALFVAASSESQTKKLKHQLLCGKSGEKQMADYLRSYMNQTVKLSLYELDSSQYSSVRILDVDDYWVLIDWKKKRRLLAIGNIKMVEPCKPDKSRKKPRWWSFSG